MSDSANEPDDVAQQWRADIEKVRAALAKHPNGPAAFDRLMETDDAERRRLAQRVSDFMTEVLDNPIGRCPECNFPTTSGRCSGPMHHWVERPDNPIAASRRPRRAARRER